MATVRSKKPDIAPMKRADLSEVMDIEEHSFRAPWSRDVFLDELSRDWARLEVLREQPHGKVAAFINYWKVRDEVHILNVATHPEHRRRGHAEALLAHVLSFAARESCRYLTLEVRRGNQAAIRLYRKFGFRAVGIRPNYYVEDHEDAIVMLLDRGK